jgi:hypothetical protein
MSMLSPQPTDKVVSIFVSPLYKLSQLTGINKDIADDGEE